MTLKSMTVQLPGADHGAPVVLYELPALVADRYARAVLLQIGEDPRGGVISLAFQHLQKVLTHAEKALDWLAPFVSTPSPHAPIRDWRNISKLQQCALLLHVQFALDRPTLEVPVALRAERIFKELPEINVTFCAPHIAAVLAARLATYHELETALSTEDVLNLVEVLNVEGIREWQAHQRARRD